MYTQHTKAGVVDWGNRQLQRARLFLIQIAVKPMGRRKVDGNYTESHYANTFPFSSSGALENCVNLIVHRITAFFYFVFECSSWKMSSFLLE